MSYDIIKPQRPLRPSKPSPQLQAALDHIESRRTKTIPEQARDIHYRVEVLRRETYLLCLRLSSSTTHYHRTY
jgi:hypothetical protein